jgi:hypothetical protein
LADRDNTFLQLTGNDPAPSVIHHLKRNPASFQAVESYFGALTPLPVLHVVPSSSSSLSSSVPLSTEQAAATMTELKLSGEQYDGLRSAMSGKFPPRHQVHKVVQSAGAPTKVVDINGMSMVVVSLAAAIEADLRANPALSENCSFDKDWR